MFLAEGNEVQPLAARCLLKGLRGSGHIHETNVGARPKGFDVHQDQHELARRILGVR